ncbi:MAG: peptidylprolyl isomerase [Ignavibacteriales bacterium]|nr:peptidylprolyl isomerase [Ignavibacteriales bacterium]
MALMTQIRDNLTTLFAVLAVFFIILIVFDWGMDYTGTRGRGGANAEVLGMINGREVSYRDFSERLRREVETQRERTKTEVDEETERQLRGQVWNSLVDETLLEQEIERLGIIVTDEEIVDVIRGPNPPEFLVQRFRDSTGTFHREDYLQAIMAPENKQAMVQVEEVIRQQLRRQKLQSLLFASVHVTEGEVLQRFSDRNITMEAEYVLFDPNRVIPDSSVVLTDNDVQKFYGAHPDEFKVRAARRLKYVVFNQLPSHADSEAVWKEMTRLQDQLATGMDFEDLAKTYSEIPVTDAYFKHGELTREKENLVFSSKKGQVVGPVKDFDGYHLIKVVDERQGKDEFVKASHILLRTVPGPDSTIVIQKARDLLRRARGGEDFAKLARENSQDFGSAQLGGELGWTGKGGWVKEFEEAAFKAKINEVVGPVRSQFGWHIIKVSGRDKRELKIIDIAMRVRSSSQTIDAALQQANDFAYLAGEEGFEKSAEVSKYEIRETPEFSRSSMIPGIGMNDAAMTFAFKAKLGEVSEPITVSGGLAVFKVSGITEEGVRPFQDVKGISRSMALKEAKMQKLRVHVEAFHSTLSPMTELLDAAKSLSNVSAQKTGPFKATDFPSGIGRDPKFIGKAMTMNPGELSTPFEGLRGFYVMKLLSKTDFDSTQYAAERVSLRDQVLQEKRNRIVSDWIASLRQAADIEDHRDKFYR